MMKAVKYLFALWAGIFVYAMFAVVFGPGGFSAFRQLEVEQKKLEANIENLKHINSRLEITMNSLLYDQDTLALLAREQGYAFQHERFIRIVGLGLNQNAKPSSGEAFFPAEPQYIDSRIIIIFISK